MGTSLTPMAHLFTHFAHPLSYMHLSHSSPYVPTAKQFVKGCFLVPAAVGLVGFSVVFDVLLILNAVSVENNLRSSKKRGGGGTFLPPPITRGVFWGALIKG